MSNYSVKMKDTLWLNCTHSVKNAMMAEIVVRELAKFTESHELIMESVQKILSRYNDIGMLIERMDKRDNIYCQMYQ